MTRTKTLRRNALGMFKKQLGGPRVRERSMGDDPRQRGVGVVGLVSRSRKLEFAPGSRGEPSEDL